MPPIIGWAAASRFISRDAWMLFATVFLRQFPHVMSIAWIYPEDYARARYVVLPNKGRAENLWPGLWFLRLLSSLTDNVRHAVPANARKSRSRVKSGIPASRQLSAISASPSRALRRFATTLPSVNRCPRGQYVRRLAFGFHRLPLVDKHLDVRLDSVPRKRRPQPHHRQNQPTDKSRDSTRMTSP
jgi:hypothetical protein